MAVGGGGGGGNGSGNVDGGVHDEELVPMYQLLYRDHVGTP